MQVLTYPNNSTNILNTLMCIFNVFPFSLIKILMFWNIHVSGYLRCDNGEFHLLLTNEILYIVKLVDMLILNSFAYFHQILIKYMPHVKQNVIIWKKVNIITEVTEHVGILLKHYLSCSSTFLNNAIQIQ
ncbi:hypothetical protein KSF78_0004611 [Schistosoma japonicum]|nr:hypothetical protein KSF78_0004611 [Schistosoma japonicum]